MSNSQQSTGDIPGAFNPSSTLSNATTSSISSNAALRSATATPPPRVTSPAITSAGLLSPPITSRTTPIQTSSNLPKPGVNYPVQALNAFENYKKKDSAKVVVRFKATGNAPIMKNNYFRITAFNRFQAVIQFLRKELGWKQGDALFLYINSSFSPAPDDTVGNLFRCFGTEGHLIVNYSTQAAWG